jgi:hypothetical protein
MHLPDEIVSVFMTALPSEIEQEQEKTESKIKRAAPSTLKLINEIHEKISQTPGAGDAIKMLREVVYKEKLLDRPFTKWTRERVLERSPMKENDVVISSYGKHPFELKRRGVSESKTTEGSQTGVLQAKVDAGRGGWDDDHATKPLSESNGGAGEGTGPSPYRKWMG